MELVYPFLTSDSALRDFVALWEVQRLPKAQWTHAAPVAVCAFYAAAFGPLDALRRMREGIPIYNVAIGVQNTEESGYHETLTCLWAKIVGDFVAAGEFATPHAAVRATVQRFGQKRKLHQEFYTYDVVMDRRARREWVPPDKKCL